MYFSKYSWDNEGQNGQRFLGTNTAPPPSLSPIPAAPIPQRLTQIKHFIFSAHAID